MANEPFQMRKWGVLLPEDIICPLRQTQKPATGV